MIIFHSNRGGAGETQQDLAAPTLPDDIVWIDLLSPTPEEFAHIEKLSGITLPRHEDLIEIESSSRLYTDEGFIFLSTPLIWRATSGIPESTPVGFVLSKERLLTIRFAELTAFTTFNARAQKPNACSSAIEIFTGLYDAVIDRLADVLEQVGSDLEIVSRRVFRKPARGKERVYTNREDTDLHLILSRIGQAGDLASLVRDSLLGLGRILPYVHGNTDGWWAPGARSRFKTLRADIESLNDYEVHLTNKVQLLLDATLGLISIEQNNIFRVLTIVSVVGIPPTLIASMYGMNFRHMPELDWIWGYPWGLGLIATSILIPLIWFKVKRWM